MKSRFLPFVAALILLIHSAGWVLLAREQWSDWVAVWSVLPLLICALFLASKKPKAYFYTALFIMPYVATAMTQIMISATGRTAAVICLAAGLTYLAILPLVLRSLNRQTNT